ncbi:MAG: hypothetical protein FWC50_08440 [Planctomycetaceae bacterium]|nr:hypothetical protein [Planctomycetaceae bacterium]
MPRRIAGHETGVNASGQPYVVVDARRWLLAPGEPPYERPAGMLTPDMIPAPPRSFSSRAKLLLMFMKNEMAIIAFFAFIFGLLTICTTIAPEMADRFATWEEAGTAEVTQVKPTGVTASGTRVFAYHYTGKSNDGVGISGVSYQRPGKLKPRQTVLLLKCHYHGEKWKLKETSFSMMGGIGSLIYLFFIFPVAGLAFFFFGSVFPGKKQISLLKNGKTALATFLEMKETFVTVNGGMLMKMSFRFETPRSETPEEEQECQTTVYRAVVYSTTPEKILDDEVNALVFYDPANPKRNMLFGSVSPIVRFDAKAGRFVSTGSRWRMFLLGFFVFCSILGCYWAWQSMTTGRVFFFVN